MSFEVVEATLADIPSLVTLHYAAFRRGPSAFKERNVPVEARDANLAAFFEHYLAHADLSGAHMYKLVDSATGALAAYAFWLTPALGLSAEQKEQWARLEEEHKKRPLPKGTDVPLAKHLMSVMAEGEAKWMDWDRDFYLYILGTHPDYQRRGCGSMLLKHGLAFADRRGARSYLAASPQGLGLYLRHGWEPVDEALFDMAKYGMGEGFMVGKRCIRPAQS